jgi:hypothetical protein
VEAGPNRNLPALQNLPCGSPEINVVLTKIHVDSLRQPRENLDFVLTEVDQ